MMTSLGWWALTLAALVLPTVCGGLLVMSALKTSLDRMTVLWSMAAGHFVGLGLTALLLALLRAAGWIDQMLPGAAVLLLLTAGVAGVAVLRRGRRLGFEELVSPESFGGAAERVLWWLLLLWLLALLLLAGSEALLRPVYPWDAWSAWSVKVRVWSELGPDVKFVAFQQWIRTEDPTVYTNEAWRYPETLPLIQYWMTQWHGGWDPTSVRVPWVSCALALGLLLYSTARLTDLSPLLSMIGTFLLLTLPILNTQVALAGYADIWLSAAMVTFVAALMLHLAGKASLWLSLASLLLVGSLKLEGVVWALIGLAAVMMVRLPRSRRLMAIAAAVAAFVLWLVTGGFSFSLAGLTFKMTPALIELPYLGRHPLGFDNQLQSLITALLDLPNWHLFWLFGLPAALWAAWQARNTADGRGLSSLLLLGLGFLFALFFFTQAAVWAESMTASNRLALHLAPAVGLWAWVLLGRQHS
ncbi:MAG: hypothetical protein AAGI67_18195 [Pseudomonadota bacterium]